VKDAEAMQASVQSNKGYLLFPLRSNPKKDSYAGKALFDRGCFPHFGIQIVWLGNASLFKDIKSLVGVFGHLGSLGFRQRRAMGALAFSQSSPGLKSCLECFNTARQLSLKSLAASDAESAINELGAWLKSWRSHGRTKDHSSARPHEPPNNPGFDPYAKNDHDRGVDCLARKGTNSDKTYRPSLGLPIIQSFKGGKVNWEWDFNREKNKPEGRFASPVLLRPHRDSQGKWHALVIFVDVHKWPDGKKVFLNKEQREVSLDLYEAMKEDKRLKNFPV